MKDYFLSVKRSLVFCVSVVQIPTARQTSTAALSGCRKTWEASPPSSPSRRFSVSTPTSQLSVSLLLASFLSFCRPSGLRYSRVFVCLQLDALSLLTSTQLAEVSATPGLLMSADQVAMVMRLVPDRLLASFFDDFAAAIKVGKHHTEIQPWFKESLQSLAAKVFISVFFCFVMVFLQFASICSCITLIRSHLSGGLDFDWISNSQPGPELAQNWPRTGPHNARTL